jgi:hypothetical protein
MSASAFAAYDLLNVATGMILYSTCATPAEIRAANDNLRSRGLPSRFYPAGTFHAPSLHTAPDLPPSPCLS